MKLSELNIKFENNIIEKFLRLILDRFTKEKVAPYLNRDGTPKDDEFLELRNINYPATRINVYRRFSNLEKWDVSFSELRKAIKLTLRNGKILGSADYNKMTGTSNFVGTPLHILIALIPEEEYKKNTLVGKLLKHPKFGFVKVMSLDFNKESINIETENNLKSIKMDFWEITEEEFKNTLNESTA